MPPAPGHLRTASPDRRALHPGASLDRLAWLGLLLLLETYATAEVPIRRLLAREEAKLRITILRYLGLRACVSSRPPSWRSRDPYLGARRRVRLSRFCSRNPPLRHNPNCYSYTVLTSSFRLILLPSPPLLFGVVTSPATSLPLAPRFLPSTLLARISPSLG